MRPTREHDNVNENEIVFGYVPALPRTLNGPGGIQNSFIHHIWRVTYELYGLFVFWTFIKRRFRWAGPRPPLLHTRVVVH